MPYVNKVYATTDATEYFERLSLDHHEPCWSYAAIVDISKDEVKLISALRLKIP